MRFERSDFTNVASAMDVDDEVNKYLTSISSDEEETLIDENIVKIR